MPNIRGRTVAGLHYLGFALFHAGNSCQLQGVVREAKRTEQRHGCVQARRGAKNLTAKPPPLPLGVGAGFKFNHLPLPSAGRLKTSDTSQTKRL